MREIGVTGENKDDVARDRAKTLIAQADRIYSVGFSFSADNRTLLGLDDRRLYKNCFVQNFENKDKRLSRILDEAHVPQDHRDDGDMDSLIRHGFFEL